VAADLQGDLIDFFSLVNGLVDKPIKNFWVWFKRKGRLLVIENLKDKRVKLVPPRTALVGLFSYLVYSICNLPVL